MESCYDKKRINVEEDRLSSLPDDLIHKILSFIGIRNAIKTSALSSRWRFIWTSLPCLDFSNEEFPVLSKYTQFVTNVLSHRNKLAEVFSIKIFFNSDFNQDFVKQFMNYACSHNIQQLDVTYLPNKDIEFPLSLFSSRSLKHLFLINDFLPMSREHFLTATSIWELPALTTLYLYGITFCDDNNDKCVGIFSKCVNLETLTLENCSIKELNSLSICHPRLSNLTIENDERGWRFFNLVAPQLKNLTVRSFCEERYLISAPELISLLYSGDRTLVLSTDVDYRSLKTLDLNVYRLVDEDAPILFHLFQRLQSVEFLTLNLEILELLSSYEELNFLKPSPFANLKSLKICPLKGFPDDEDTIKVKDYLLNNSPNATFTVVSREETSNINNTILAQALMWKLQVVLEQEKAKFESNMAHIEQEKLQVENQLQIRERATYINNFCTFLTEEIIKGRLKTHDINLKLELIEELLSTLPTSINAEMQPFVSSLSTDVDTVVGNMKYYAMVKCDMKESLKDLTAAYFKELASTSRSSR